MPKKRLPAIADRAVWEKATKGQAGRLDSVVEKVWKGIGGNQKDVLPIEKLGGYTTDVKERIERRARLAQRNCVKEDEHTETYGGAREETGMETYWHGPMD